MKPISRRSLILAAALFFVATAWAARPVGGLYDSPDETANAFWAGQVARTAPLVIRDVAVGLGRGTVHPRSFAVVSDALVSGSFPGLFLLYGTIRIATRLPLWAMTPLLSALAGLILFSIVRRLHDERTGAVAALLFWLHPAVLYYAGRGLFHNELFVDCLIFGTWFLAARPLSGLGRKEWADDAIGGAVLAWALVTRASEALWVLPAVIAFFAVSKRVAWRSVAAVMAGAAAPLFIFLAVNAALYGSPLKTAYVAPQPASEEAAPAPSSAEGAQASVLPFGFHPRLAAVEGTSYGLEFFWWFTIPAALGFFLALATGRRAPPARRRYPYVFAAVAFWLVLFYGSWFIRDRFDPTQVTIGTSYVRYFLPMYVLGLPLAASGLVWLADRLKFRFALSTLLIVIAALSLRAAFFAGDESLLAVRRVLAANAAKKPALLAAIPAGAVVMTEKFDKVLFPERPRIIPSTDAASFRVAGELARYVPVYWYGLDPTAQDLAALEDRAGAGDLMFIDPSHPVAGETLYHLVLVGYAE